MADRGPRTGPAPAGPASPGSEPASRPPAGPGPAGAARRRRVAARISAAACAGFAVIIATGCAAVPDGGLVTSATVAQAGGQHQTFVQMIPSGPQQGWDPAQIVTGFLLATASFASNHAIARQYLTPAAGKAWQPGSSVLEFADTPSATTNYVTGNTVTVQVTGDLIGVINDDGQYQEAEPGIGSGPWNITVVRVKGQWRIVDPPNKLLFSARDVGRTFRSRDLYFFDPTLSVLVPDPVYVPAEATPQQLLANLVDALQLGPPRGWLVNGVRTAFPAGTSRRGAWVAGSTATVNLSGSAAKAGAQQRQQMADQLLETLASAPDYQPPDALAVQSVVFEINGKPVRFSCATGDPPALAINLCTPPLPMASGSRAYYVDGRGQVATLFSAPSQDLVAGPAGTGRVPFSRVAVSPDQMTVAGVFGGALYTGSMTQNGTLRRRLDDLTITAMSWESPGDLWFAGQVRNRTGVWWLGLSGQPEPVSLPPAFGPVTALRVAPDGVRVAMITGSGAGARLWLAAIQHSGDQVAIGPPVHIGTDVSSFTDLTWYDTGDVIALTRPPSGAQLYEIPVDGGPSRAIATESGMVSITASAEGALIAARADGTLVQLPGPNATIWRPASASGATVRGQSPVYPG